MIRSAALLGSHCIGGITAQAGLRPATSAPAWRSLGIRLQPPQPSTVKILITGGLGTGKTTLIRTVSQRFPHTTDVAVTTAPGWHTTAAGETGWLRLHTGPHTSADTGPDTEMGTGLDLLLAGTPGHPRYRYLWPNLASGARAALVLADPARLADGYPALELCKQLALPHILVITSPTLLCDNDIRDAADLAPGVVLRHGDPQRAASIHRILHAAVAHLGLPPTGHQPPATTSAATTAEHHIRDATAASDRGQSPDPKGAP